MLVLWADPFGIESATSRASIDLFQRVLSPFYSTENQDKVRIILISDEDLPMSGDGPPAWPPAYEDYVTLLDVLGGTSDFRPSAVFLDILFENVPKELEGIDAFCKKATSVTNAGSRVVLAALPNSDFDELPVPSALQLCASYRDEMNAQFKLASVGWRAEYGLYPFSVIFDEGTEPTAAAALYSIALEEQANADQKLQQQLASNIKSAAEMRIVWGGAMPLGALPVPGKCEDTFRGGFFDKSKSSLKILLNGLTPLRARRDAFKYPQPCAFHEVIPARRIMNMSPEERVDFAASIDGAFVFVGADVDGIPDFVDSPVHGRLPGVFIHAMAFDNFMTLGDSFLRDSQGLPLPFGGFDVPVDMILQGGVLLALALTLAAFRSRPSATLIGGASSMETTMRFVRGTILNAGIAAMFSLFVLLIALTTYLWLRWTPMNYGAVLLVGAAMIFSTNPEFGSIRGQRG